MKKYRSKETIQAIQWDGENEKEILDILRREEGSIRKGCVIKVDENDVKTLIFYQSFCGDYMEIVVNLHQLLVIDNESLEIMAIDCDKMEENYECIDS